MKKHLITFLFFVGYLAIVFGAIAGILEKPFAFYVFTIGVVALCAYRICTLSAGDFRVKRLNAMGAFSTLLLIASCTLMYMQLSGWVLTLFVAALIDLIVSIRYPNQTK